MAHHPCIVWIPELRSRWLADRPLKATKDGIACLQKVEDSGAVEIVIEAPVLAEEVDLNGHGV